MRVMSENVAGDRFSVTVELGLWEILQIFDALEAKHDAVAADAAADPDNAIKRDEAADAARLVGAWSVLQEAALAFLDAESGD